MVARSLPISSLSLACSPSLIDVRSLSPLAVHRGNARDRLRCEVWRRAADSNAALANPTPLRRRYRRQYLGRSSEDRAPADSARAEQNTRGAATSVAAEVADRRASRRRSACGVAGTGSSRPQRPDDPAWQRNVGAVLWQRNVGAVSTMPNKDALFDALEYGRRRSCVSFKSHTSADPADRPAVVLLHPAEQRVLRIFPFPSSLSASPPGGRPPVPLLLIPTSSLLLPPVAERK